MDTTRLISEIQKERTERYAIERLQRESEDEAVLNLCRQALEMNSKAAWSECLAIIEADTFDD